jgi:hypothetical protein
LHLKQSHLMNIIAEFAIIAGAAAD